MSATAVTDSVDVAAARAGRPDALAALYRSHAAALYGLAYRLTGTRQDAEDVVHDVFVGLPEALGRYQERGELAAWLKRVTARVALMRLRGRKRRREVALDGTEAGSDPSNAADRIALQAAVDALPDRLRVVLVLKEIEGYSHAEIGGLLGISAVASRGRRCANSAPLSRRKTCCRGFSQVGRRGCA